MMLYQKAHELLGHMSGELVKKLAQSFVQKLISKVEAVCAAKQKNVPKCSTHEWQNRQGRSFLGCFYGQAGGGKARSFLSPIVRLWLMREDTADFFNTKAGTV